MKEKKKGVAKIFGKVFYKENRKERIRQLSKDAIDDLNSIVEEKGFPDGMVDQTKAVKDIWQMELELERNEMEAWERGTKVLVMIGTFAVGAYFMKKNFDFNSQYMMLVYNQKDSMDIINPRMQTAFLKSKDNFSRMADNSLNSFKLKGGL